MKCGTHVNQLISSLTGLLLFFLCFSLSGQAPVVGDIPDLTIDEGQAFTALNLDDYVEDPDYADDQINWTYSNNSELSVSIDNRIATVTAPSSDWYGSETITFTATDPDDNTDSDDALFTVNAVNDAPVVSDIPGQTIDEGESFVTVSLDDYVADVDNDDDQITWTASGNSQLSVNITSRVATIGIPDPDWNGSENITFTATDPSLDSDSDPATFTVNSVNDAPVVSDIPGQTINEGESFATVNLDDYMNDVDHDDYLIAWTYTGASELDVNIDASHVATIMPPSADWIGSEIITFIATDPESASDSDPATFTVLEVNEAPVVSDIPDQTIDEGQSFVTINLDDYVADPDNPDTDITWTASGNSQLSVDITDRVATIGIPNPDWNGSENITFTATDPSLDSDSDPATFTVNAVNDAPVVSDIPGQTINEGESFVTVSLDDYVTDVDNDDDQITWTASGNSQLSVNITSRVATIGIPDPDWNGSENITFTATDPSLDSDSDPATFTVMAVNDPPVVSDIPNQSINEGQSFAPINLDDYVNDVDHNDYLIAWTYTGASELDVNIDASHVATIMPPSADWIGSEIITFIATDPESASDSDPATFSVMDVNDVPVLANIESAALAYTEGDGQVPVTSTITVSDVDNTDLASATITISSSYQSGQDILSFTDANGITGSWNIGGGVLTLTGTSSVANYQNALRTVKYQNTSENPVTSTRTVSFVVNDGTGNSNTLTRDIAITAVNDAPVLVEPSSATVNFTENGGPVQVTSTVTASDADNTNLASATISITLGFQSGQDVLAFTSGNGINGSYNSSLGVLPLSGSSSVANYQTALRSVTYNNTSENPITTQRTISFTVNDGISASNTVTRNVAVSAVNDPPVLSGIEGTALAYTEGSGQVQVTATIAVSDVDHTNLSSATVNISGNYQSGEDVLAYSTVGGISGSWDSGTGTMTLTGVSSVANYQSALHNVTYQNTSPTPNTSTRTVSFVVNDGTGNSNTQTRNITINAVNSPPVLTEPSSNTVSFTENGGAVQVTNTVSVSDIDNPNLASATISITSGLQSGQDVLSFTGGGGISGSYNSSLGELSLSGSSSQANYQTVLRSVTYNNTSENPNTSVRTVSFTVSDGTASSNTVSRNVSVTAVNDPPVLSGIEGSALAYTEGSGEVSVTSSIAVADVDNTTISSATIQIAVNYHSDQDALTFSPANGISGNWVSGTLTLSGVSSVANYQAALRNVKYVNSSDNPNTDTRSVSFTVNDGTANSNTVSRSITINPTNTPPVLSGIEGTTLAYTENDPAMLITSSIAVADADNTNLASALVKITSNYQNGQDVLSFVNSYGITGIWTAAQGELALSGTTAVSNYQLALRSIRYSNTSENPVTSTRAVTFTVNDGVANSNSVFRNISVTAVNDAPVAVNDNYAVSEGGTLTVAAPGVLQNDTDAEGATLTAGKVTDPAHGTLTLNTNGSFTYIHDGSETSTDAFTYRASDGLLQSNTATVNITITPVNDPPVASGVSITPADARIGILNSGQFTYTDPDGDAPGVHQYKWYRANTGSGSGETAIPGATSLTYTPVIADGSKWICFEITPVDIHGLAGTPVKSAYKYINAAPVASSAQISAPSAQVGKTITGSFNYFDFEGNPQGTPIYQWYRKDNASNTPATPGTPIGTNSSSYTLVGADAGKYIWFKVKPTATTGSTPGDSVWSNIIGPIGAFSANISGTAGYCSGTSMPITLTITGGQQPYTATLQRTGSLAKDTTITGITTSPYIIQVKIAGTYTLKSVIDANIPAQSAVVSTDPVVLTVYPRATARLTGGATICNDGVSTTPLTLNFLSGTAPWTFTVRRKENPAYDTIFTNITSDPYVFNGRVIGTTATRYRVIILTDVNNCPGDTSGSGSAWVSYKASPTAVISGVDTICPGGTAELRITLTGTAPWNITYVRNGINPIDINNINSPVYTLQVASTGTYTLTKVQDVLCTGKVSGTGIVRQYAVPTATLSGSATICENTSGNLSVALTGTSPWRFSYRLDAETPIEVLNVKTSPRNISVQQPGTYTLVEMYDRNCKGTVSGSATLTVTPAPEVTITGLAPAYNLSTIRVPVFGHPENGTFAYHPALIESKDTMFFYPIVAGIGTHNIIYYYQDPGTSCFGFDTAVVRVLTANATIVFENDRTKYCRNDRPFTVTGINLAGDIGSFSISGGTGLVDHNNNTATVYPAMLNENNYIITYTYFDGTVLYVQSDFEIGRKPEAKFTWESECFHEGQSINLKDASTSIFGQINNYKWKIFTSTGYDSLVTKDIEYTFAQPGNYDIALEIATSYGCRDTVETTFGLRPVKIPHKETYYEDFENQPISWRSGTSPTITANSWLLGDPSKGFNGASSGDYCWYTYIPGASAPREQTWVTGPCFDFTGMERPMIKMDMWRWFNVTRDGATIQATADSGKTWQNIGQLQDGVRWFNEYNILGNPGGQTIGWSNIQDVDWQEARHSLDMLKDKKDVQFRIAYGSDGTARNNNGFAFDNIWIGERNKMALLEHFTNSSDAICKEKNEILNAAVNDNLQNIIDLQYHTSFPGPDPFNEQNPYISSARVLYYGLSDVPYTVLDGGSTSEHIFDYDLRNFDLNKVLIQSLIDSKFWINIRSRIEDPMLIIQVEVHALENIPLSELTVHIAVIENQVTDVTGQNGETSFESVVLTMLPDAAGTTLYRAWNATDYTRIDQNWIMDGYSNIEELRVVAFIQDEATHEIYQAAMDTAGIWTAIVDRGVAEKTAYLVYPNPASTIAYVKFDDPLRDEVKVELYNNLGSLVFAGRVPEGTREIQIPVDNYPYGVYLLRMSTSDRLIGVNKITINR
jgi:VCBS repeat-containing protein